MASAGSDQRRVRCISVPCHGHQPCRQSNDSHLALTTIVPLQTLYNSMLENNCSEQSSRMSAMENSTKNAGEMLGKVGWKQEVPCQRA